MTTAVIFCVGAMSAVLASSGAAAQSKPCSLTGLAWMAGDWRNEKTPDRAQERWVVAPSSVLMGSSFEFPAGKAGYAEAMTIRGDSEGISMVLRHFDGALSRAWEEKTQPMIFTAATCGTDTVVFDGQGDHEGERISYRRSGATLLIVGDFIHKGVPDRETWRMVKAGN